ncbi:MAG: hypothetical protein D6760_08675 [Deltaproteobacteria bacterium]|nr:MAG: hypothetical protein D6760_08675 [Deltaproteobacteria bacterium]
MPDRVVVCYACGLEHTYDTTLSRRATCDRCSAELHCCRNCRFYEPGAYNDCREPSAERVVDKEASNFCDLFEPAAGPSTGSASSAKDDLERLFRK